MMSEPPTTKDLIGVYEGTILHRMNYHVSIEEPRKLSPWKRRSSGETFSLQDCCD